MIATLCLALVSAPPLLVHVPVGGLAPDVARGGGTTYVAYGDRRDAFVGVVDEAKNTIERPVRVNDVPGTVIAGGERGPKIAWGTNALHVAWMDTKAGSQRVAYARSANRGKSFETARNLLAGSVGIDMVTVAARGRQVVVLWLDGRGGLDADNPATSPIYLCESKDGGNTFGPNQRIGSPYSGTACACCTLSASFDDDGTLSIAFRTGYKNVRDIWLLQREAGQNAFSSVRVSDDQWSLKTCPMDGPRWSAGPGRPLIAWMSAGKVWWSEKAGSAFLPRKPLTDGRAKYPMVARSPAGEVLGVWEEGGKVHWRNLPEGESGAFPSSGERSAVYVGADGRFRIIN